MFGYSTAFEWQKITEFTKITVNKIENLGGFHELFYCRTAYTSFCFITEQAHQ